MNPEFNKRIYAVIPIEKANLFIKSNFENARKSLDGNFIIWDQAWDPPTIEIFRIDNDVKLMDHQGALALMKTPAWLRPDE
jgi:hypothetical protein